MKKRRINVKDTYLERLARKLNLIALISCWVAISLDIVYFMVTDNTLKAILFGMYTPIRYFFFDITPEKERRRPPSLDRTIPLTLFVRYLSRKFPILWGSLMADLWGFFLAVGRATVNGYALLWFDTFSFAYQIRRDKNGVPLTDDITILHDNERLEALKYKIEHAYSDEDSQQFENMYNEIQQVRQTDDLDQWNFPIRRYIQTSDEFIELKEVGAEVYDDKDQIDQKEYQKHLTRLKLSKGELNRNVNIETVSDA